MIRVIKYQFICFIIFALLAIHAKSQNFDNTGGLPFVRNYTPEEFHAHEKSFEMVQDINGLMYFANFAGILEFDGTNWVKIPSSSGMRILSVDVNNKGKVFAGGLYDFGYLEKDKKGFTHFVSLADSSVNRTNIGLIFKVLCVDTKTYFFSDKAMYLFDGAKTEKIVLDNQALSAFQVNKQIFVLFDNKNVKSSTSGLCIYHDRKFVKIALRSELPFQNIKFMIPTNREKEIMIGTENQGIFLLKNNEFIEFTSPINEFLKKNALSSGIKSKKSGYAIGTSAGIALINENGQILRLIDRDSKLLDENINSLFLDKNASMWITGNNGISKAEINWPLSYIDNKTSGLSGKVQDIEEFANTLYLATDEGLFYIDGASIKKINKINGACLSLLKLGNYLLAATSRGLFKVNGQNIQPVENSVFTFYLVQSSANSNIIFAGQNKKVIVYQVDNNNLKPIQTITGLPGDVIKLVEDKDGDLFLEVSPGQVFVYKSKIKQLVEIRSEKSFTFLHLNKKAGEIFLSSEKGLYSVNKTLNILEPFSIVPKDPFSQKLWIQDLFEISENSAIITNGEQKALSFISFDDQRYTTNQTQYLPIATFSLQTFWLNKQKTQLWAGGKDGLIISNYTDLFDYSSTFKTMIRKIRILSRDSLIEQNENSITRISYSNNSLQFEFSAPVFPAMGKVEYRYFLKGFDKDTSNWDSPTKKDYTNLPDGEYKFMVEARNEFGNVANKAEFSFKILTPIFRQWWALLIYIFLLVVILRFYFIWRMRASEKEKDRLEEIVKERTEEIELSKKKIEEQRDIAYKQKKEILDSISYAQKIQQAVLPSTQFVDDILLEHFIYYKPRDIVSGDFYWMKKINNYIAVVAADCTGHGVPGAFMSMLGSSFLNEIVTRRSMDSAAQILNRLRTKVKQSLHQEGKEGEQKDGMDIALLIIDSETLILQYAGAYNPLYIIRPQEGVNLSDESIDVEARYELIHLKADRQPIGIHLAEKEFTNHVFQLKNGDNLYSFSDGYVDQFGGETGEKFKSKRFKELLMSAQGKPMFEQKQILEQAFMKWKRDLAQIDDVLVMGLKV